VNVQDFYVEKKISVSYQRSSILEMIRMEVICHQEQQETLICQYFDKLLTRTENCQHSNFAYNEVTHALNYYADFYQFISNL
jgi:hypothetical protein